MTKIIDKYTNPAHPGSFTGLSGFLNNNKSLVNLHRVYEIQSIIVFNEKCQLED
jgi:hypothetical protein